MCSKSYWKRGTRISGINGNVLYVGMKLLNYLFSIHVRNFMLILSRTNARRDFCSTTAHNECPMGSSLRIFMPNYKRNFMFYAVTYSKKTELNDEAKSNKERSQTGKHKQGPMVSVIDENDVESVMLMADAEKLAKRKNLKLVLHESRRDKVKYKLQKSSVTTELKKGKEKDKKRVVLRGETQLHDVEIKINQMMKFLDKGLNVVCIIEGSRNEGNSGKVREVLEQSKLKDFLISVVTNKKNVQLTYGPQSDSKGKKPQEEEDKKSASK